jgi:hypothetical protein
MSLPIKVLAMIACFSSILTSTYAKTAFFTDYTITNIYHQYIGKVSFENEMIENYQDELGVFVADNNNNALLIGACRIGENYPGYYFVNVYGNDSQTAIKDGANVGDTLTFKIWDKSENKQYVLSNSNSLSSETAPGILYPDLPPIFQSGFGAQYGYLNLIARNQDLNESTVYFNAISQQDSIKLIWSTGCENNLTSFLIFRNSAINTDYINISTNMIQTKGTEFSGADYCFIDNDVLSNILYNYQLIAIDLDGQQSIVQTLMNLSVCQSCSTHFDLNGDKKFGLADIIELMKRIIH